MTRKSTTFAVVVGQTLVHVRVACGVSQGVMSKKLGLSQSTISRIEHGSVTLTLEVLAQYARLLDASASTLLQAAELSVQLLERNGVRVHYDRRRSGLDAKAVGALIALGVAKGE